MDIPTRPRRPHLPTRLRRRRGRRSFRRRGRRAHSRLRLAPGRLRFLAALYDFGLVIRVEPQSRVDRLLSRQRVGVSLGLPEGLAVYLLCEVADELPLQDGPPDRGDLVLGVGVEVEAY